MRFPPMQIAGAARCLRVGGRLITYGPYKVDGQHTGGDVILEVHSMLSAPVHGHDNHLRHSQELFIMPKQREPTKASFLCLVGVEA